MEAMELARSESGGTIKRNPVNLSIREDLVVEAKALGINVSQVAERALIESVNRARGAAWQKENAEAIDEHNERVARTGLFNEGLRRF